MNGLLPVEYLTAEIAKRTKYKSIKDAYERNTISVIKDGCFFYLESCGCPDKTYRLTIRETKRIFPYLTYLYDAKDIDRRKNGMVIV